MGAVGVPRARRSKRLALAGALLVLGGVALFVVCVVVGTLGALGGDYATPQAAHAAWATQAHASTRHSFLVTVVIVGGGAALSAAVGVLLVVVAFVVELVTRLPDRNRPVA